MEKIQRRLLLFVVLLVLVIPATPASTVGPGMDPTPLAAESFSANSLRLVLQVSHQSAKLRLVGPQGFEVRRSFGAGETVQLQLLQDDDASLPDGRYMYELRLWEESGDRTYQRGVFFIENGAAVSREAKRAQFATVRQELNETKKELGAAQSTTPVFMPKTTVESPLMVEDWAYTNQASIHLTAWYGSSICSGKTTWQIESEAVPSGRPWDPPFDYCSYYDGYLHLQHWGNPLITLTETDRVGIGTAIPSAMLHVYGDAIIEGDVSLGSSRAAKHELARISPTKALTDLLELPIYTWKYRDDPHGATHVGPMAEDFRTRFGLGIDERHISPADSAGLALLGIQGLHRRLEERARELEAENSELRVTLQVESAELQRRLEALEDAVTHVALPVRDSLTSTPFF